MKRDIYQTISQMESADGGTSAPAIVDTQGVAYDVRAKTGREIWTVRRGDSNVRYDVSTAGNANGGTDYEVRKLPIK